MQITGGCLCGAVRYESKAPPVVTRTCWCRLCQYHGTTSDFMSIADSGNVMHRKFCPNCGTPLFSSAESRPHLIFVRAGSLDDPELARPAMTIWTEQAPSWACIAADLPRVERQPPPATV